jgi:antitoxin component YwqK of YwqJK toxin-antitoxin module
MDILNTNIIRYILNPYLDYQEDILKLKQLYPSLQNNFPIKPHIKFTTHQISYIYKNTYLDNKKIRKRSYYIQNYFTNRQIHSINNYKNNKLHGRTEQYYFNGQKELEFNYTMDKKEGIQKKWEYNGDPKYEHYYKNGYKDDIQKDWDIFGKMVKSLYNCDVLFCIYPNNTEANKTEMIDEKVYLTNRNAERYKRKYND